MRKLTGGQPGNTNHRLPYGESARRNLFSQYRQRAQRTGKMWNLTLDDFVRITQMNCEYCGIEPSQVYQPAKHSNGSYLYNGIDRQDTTRGYEPDNSVACCFTCNVAKASMSREQFFQWIKRMYEKIVA